MEFNLNYHINQIAEIKHMVYGVLREKSYKHVMFVHIEGAVTKEPVRFEDRLSLTYRTYELQESWGNLFDCAWFIITGKLNDFSDISKDELFIKLDVSGEALLFNKHGVPMKGFTNGSSVFDRAHGEPGKIYYQITELIEKDGSFELWFDAGANDLFGSLQNQGRIISAEIVERNKDIRNLYHDFSTLFDLLDSMNQTEKSYQPLFNDLRSVYIEVIYEKSNWMVNSKKIADKWLNKKSNETLNVYAVGHAHMDLAWLWPLRETRRKVGRTIANVLDMLDRYPDYIFGISQPQQIEWLRQDYPDLFKRFKHYVDLNRIELQGGMWVEPDTNVSGGESLIRQVHYGQTYYEEHFGKKVNNLWLPDVFGYSGNIPQIMKRSGLDFFMTTKISWNLVNKFPYHSFIWEGIDGSKVMTHMPPEGTYNSSIRPNKLKYMSKNYVEGKDIPIALNLFGIGDGGGGPGYEHLERINRTKDLESLPKIKIRKASDFFNDLSHYANKMNTWKGELYLENHQGTLTSQAELKKTHRFMESRLRTVEMLLTHYGFYDTYKNTLDGIWKEHLLYEFHDILPGTSIKRVYNECLARYEVLHNMLDDILSQTFDTFTKNPTIDSKPFNPNIFPVEHVIKLGSSYIVYHLAPLSNQVNGLEIYKQNGLVTNTDIELKDYVISFDEKTGQIDKIIHKVTKKNLLVKNHANILSVYQDLGDAWNIMDHYRKQEPSLMKLINRKMASYGRFLEIVQTYIFKESTLVETVLIDQEKNQITFDHDVDWQNVGYMLRTNFPLNIKTDEALFDIQFGEIKRPRTTNNSIEEAKFEVCGHQWASIYDGTYGASLINNGKYGFHVQHDAFDMNLLRSTNYPAVNGDIGKTSYKYALVLHDKNHVDAKIDELAAEFNSYYPYFNSVLEDKAFFTVNHPDIDYSAIKEAYDEKGIIIRFYEKHGSHTKLNIYWKKTPKKVYITNLVEEIEEELVGNEVTFNPYQIQTLKVVF